MNAPLVYIHSDVPEGMTLLTWRTGGRTPNRRPKFWRRVLRVLTGAWKS